MPIHKKIPSDPKSYTFSYQRDTYILQSVSPPVFTVLPYPSSSNPPLAVYHAPKGLSSADVPELQSLYGKNEFNIPIPSFSSLFAEHATAPFFVFQVFCVALWCLDEYWYYSLFTLFMLVVFECTVVWQVCLGNGHSCNTGPRLTQCSVFVRSQNSGQWRSLPSLFNASETASGYRFKQTSSCPVILSLLVRPVVKPY